MTKKDFLLQLLQKLEYSAGDPFDNITNALIGVVNAVEVDDHLLTVVEGIIQQSMKQTLGEIQYEKVTNSLKAIQKVKSSQDEKTLDDIIGQI